MCKYCDVKPEEYGTVRYGSSSSFGEEMLPGTKVGCKIEYSKGYGYSLYVVGETEEWTDKISYCPFCGKKLKD